MYGRSITTGVVLVVAAAVLAAGCSAIRRSEAESTEEILAAAGFTMQVADDPTEAAKLEALDPPLKLISRVKDGKVVYTYADPYNCKCVYVGTEAQYQQYRRLALQKQIADEQLEAAEAAESAATMGPWWWW
ncbi:hypothetical protein L6Q96_00115 [Candidatus Binatia bacterium]|nr:hypothetical protein [Candidatus Binatia bacterium]